MVSLGLQTLNFTSQLQFNSQIPTLKLILHRIPFSPPNLNFSTDPPPPLKKSFAEASGDFFLGFASRIIKNRIGGKDDFSSNDKNVKIFGEYFVERESNKFWTREKEDEIAAVLEDPLQPEVVWEQRLEDVEAERRRKTVSSHWFSFPAAGLLFPYHLGVAQFLIEKSYIKVDLLYDQMTDGYGDGDGEGHASPDPISGWQVEQLDGGNDLSPVSSRYSSCGESEFDKYFSSNSVMGTPSMRSSVGPFRGGFESEFGSLKSLDNFSLGGSFERKVDDKKIDGVLMLHDSYCGSTDYHLESRTGVVPDLSTALVDGLYNGDGDDGRVLSWDCAMSGETQHFSDNLMTHSNLENVSNVGVGTLDGDLLSSRRIDHVENCLDKLNTGSGMRCDITKSGGCSDDGEASSRYEYSEGEDSMFGYGSGDEKQIVTYDNRCIQHPQDEGRMKENALLMNSSTAFGADDWDDYMQETNATPLSAVLDDLWVQKQQIVGSDKNRGSSTFASTNGFQNICLPVQQEGKTSDNLSQDADKLIVDIGTCSTDSLLTIDDAGKKDICAVTDGFRALSPPKQSPQMCSGRIFHVKDQNSLLEDSSLKACLNIRNDELKGKTSCTSTDDETSVIHASDIKSEKTNPQLDSITKVTVSHLHSTQMDGSEVTTRESLEDNISNSLQLMTENNVNRTMKETPASNHPAPVKVRSHKINEFYDEIVHDMEEILLDANRSPGSRFTQGNRSSQFQITMPLRDGSSTASSSDNAYSLMNRPLRIDRVEVVGARQKKGDVSLSERLVGVKEYTVYRLQVWIGEEKWEVERRYRDFYTLYRRLKSLFSDQGWILPSPWSSVERESRKIFGNASPAAIAERSVLIKDCLQSLLDSRFSFSHSSALMWFLSTPKVDRSSPASFTEMPGSTLFSGDHAETISAFGKTISLIVEIWPNKSKRQILESQNYTCSGCHKHFDNGKTRIQDLVQNLGWGKPRLCEYSGQLFCSSCHTNETAVLPARVLHFWDFTQYPVSQLAKYYLDSIHDQPMLCVSAVNPLLFSKVPALQHVTNVRKRIGAMLPYVRCPFRRTIFKGLSSRRYLLESNDFFALRDLIDLSKGVFAVLPVMVEDVSKKILEHITEQCLVCCDVGVPCNARQACEDPSSLIFPFQEGDVKRCRSCKLVFHKSCFQKITTCPCGVHLNLDEAKELGTKRHMDVDGDSGGSSDFVGRQDYSWSSSVSLLSGLFSKPRVEKFFGHKDDENVIPMASLPNTSL